MKSAYYLILVAVLLASCSTAPSVNTVQTAIAETQAAQPTPTPIPTNTPYPTYTPFPTVTPTQPPSSTVTTTPATSCSPQPLHLIDIVPSSGKGVFETVDCSKSDPDKIQDIMVTIPTGTPNTMINEAMLYVYVDAMNGGWDRDDVYNVIQLMTSDCTGKIVKSGTVSGFCIAVGQESKIYTFLEIP
jgi:hypothetical protein